MSVPMELAVALGAGLLARHVAIRAGRALASGTRLRVPALCGYATAGSIAGLVKLGLTSWIEVPELTVSLVFGGVWGVVAGVMLPLARRPTAAGADEIT